MNQPPSTLLVPPLHSLGQGADMAVQMLATSLLPMALVQAPLGHVLFANQTFQHLVGGAATSQSGLPLETWWAQAGAQTGAHQLLAALQSEQCLQMHAVCFQNPNSSELRYFHVHARPLAGTDEQASLMMLQWQDATAEVQARQALAKAQAQLRCLHQSPLLGIITWQIDGCILDANDAFLAMLGYEASEIASGQMFWNKMTPPGWEKADEQGIRELQTLGHFYPFEKQYLHKDGHLVDVLVGGATFEDTRAEGMAWILNISKRKQAERQLQKVNHQLSALVNCGQVQITYFKALRNAGGQLQDFVVQSTNPAVAEAGIAVDNGSLLTHIFPGVQQHPIWQEITNVMETGQLSRFETFLDFPLVKGWFDISYSKFEDGFISQATDITERKQALEALRESENRLRSLADNLPDVISRHDRQFRYTFANRRIAHYAGLQPEQLVGKNFEELSMAPATRNFFEAQIAQVFRTGEAQTVEFKNPLGPGYLLARLTPETDAQGQVNSVLIINTDITERKEIEKALALSEHRFRNIFESVAISLWEEDFSQVEEAILELKASGVTDFATYFRDHPAFVQRCLGLVKVTDVNDATVRLFEAESKADILGNLPSIFSEDTMPIFIGELLAVANGQEKFEAECRLNTLKGNGVHTLFTMRLPAANAAFNRVLFSVLDISERKKAEDALKESEQRFRSLANDTSAFMFTGDADANVLFVNRQWLQFVGLEYEHGIGKAWQQVTHPEDVTYTLETYLHAAKNLIPYTFTIRQRRHDGQYRWVRWEGSARQDHEGRFAGVVGVGLDVTEQKAFEQELAALVAGRTKELQRSNEDLQQFAHVASHDFKEPVRKIRTYSERLLREFGNDLPQKARQYLEKMEKSCNRIYSMVDGVLAYASLDGFEGREELVDMNDLVQQVRDDLELPILQKGAMLHAEGLPTVKGLATLLYQLLYNLTSNALKFSRPGVVPQVRIYAGMPRLGHATLFVEDNGIGFPPEQAEAIFKTFIRLNAKDEFEGTGLGLALCKKIVERHGGSITASGQLGQGARFEFSLPLA